MSFARDLFKVIPTVLENTDFWGEGEKNNGTDWSFFFFKEKNVNAWEKSAIRLLEDTECKASFRKRERLKWDEMALFLHRAVIFAHM